MVLSRDLLESSANIPILTLTHHDFELRRGSSHPSVVILNLTSPSLPIVRLLSQMIWLLTLILSRESLESSANLLILTLTHHVFELRYGPSHTSVVISNLTSPILTLQRLLYQMILVLICQPVFDSGGVIARVFRGPFLINSSCHDSEKVDQERKISSQMCLHMAVYLNYISYR